MPVTASKSKHGVHTTVLDDSDIEESIAKGAVEGAIEATHNEDNKRSWKNIGVFFAVLTLLVLAYVGYRFWYKPRMERKKLEAAMRTGTVPAY